MTGLEKMLAAIADGADERAERILSDSKAKAENIKTEAVRNANAESERTVKKAESNAMSAIENARSIAKLESAKEILALKNELIYQAIKRSRDEILSLESGAYFSYLYKIASAYIHSGSCVLLLNEKDKNRMPNDFIEKLNRIREDCSIRLSNDTADIAGGFILDYGGTLENCDLDALIEAKREVLRRKAAEKLFG